MFVDFLTAYVGPPNFFHYQGSLHTMVVQVERL